MKKLILFLLCFTSLQSFSSIQQAPPNFMVGNKKTVFVDFLRATYNITYDANRRKAYADTIIVFNMHEAGHPIFDSVTAPEKSWVDGKETQTKLIRTPDNASKVRLVQSFVKPGIHSLRIRTQVKNGTRFYNKRVSSGFFIKDLKDRLFLEKYLPTNYEYDQYSMRMKIKIVGTRFAHNLFANGKVTELAKNTIEVEYPNFYTASSVYFHLVPKNRFWRLKFQYKSISGKSFPVTIYSNFRFRNWRLKKRTLRVLKELEQDYGPWPHPALLIYGTKLKGGMEYVGATATSYISLGHELQHSYFAKGILPANGNSGWMDEAIASWRDKGHKTLRSPDYKNWNLGNHSVYTRKTDKNSYKRGRSFIAYLDYKLKKAGLKGMKDFLRKYFHKRKFTTVTTEDFKKDLEKYSGLNLEEDFNQYIYGKYLNSSQKLQDDDEENIHHPRYTKKELESLI